MSGKPAEGVGAQSKYQVIYLFPGMPSLIPYSYRFASVAGARGWITCVSLDTLEVDKYFNACLHLAGFEYATNAIIIANELGIQTGFGKLCLQKQILH